MQTDPMPYIIAAAIFGAMFGFFGCALFASRRILETRDDAFQDGYDACNRDHHNRSL